MHTGCICKWDFKDGFLDPLTEPGERGGQRGLQKEVLLPTYNYRDPSSPH